MKPCDAPDLWSEAVDPIAFEVMDGEGQVNTVLKYAAHVVAVYGECSKRHDSLIKHREELK